MSDRDVRKLAKIVADHSRQIKGLSGGPQAAYSSIEGGSMDSYDSDGKLRLRIGAQDDGTQGVKYVQGPPPPRPTAPVVSVDGPVVRVRWDGMLLGGHIPEDFARIDVHFALASDDLEDEAAVRGNLATSAGNETVLAATETGTYRVGLVAMSQSRARSEMSETVDVDVTLVDIEGALDAVVENARGGSNHYSPTKPPGTDHDPDRDLWFDTSVDAEGLVSYSPHRWDADLQEWVSVADQRTAALQDALGDFEGTVEQRFTDADTAIDGLRDSLTNLDETTLPALRQDLDATEGRLGEAEGQITDAFGQLDAVPGQIDAARQAAEQAAQGYTDAQLSSEAADLAAAIAVAQATADEAMNTADGAIRTYYEPVAPTLTTHPGLTLGDMWYDTVNEDAYRWNGAQWNIIQDSNVAVALAKAEEALAVADGKITTYRQDNKPSTGELGDLWFDTDDNNAPYYCTSEDPVQWVLVRDEEIAAAELRAAQDAKDKADQALQDAQDDAAEKADAARDAAIADATGKIATARQEAIDAALTEIDAVEGTLQSSIDAKRDITWSTSSPPAVYHGPVGSTWFKMSGEGSGAQVESQWRWNGNVWVSTILSSAVLAKVDIGEGTFGTLDGLRLKVGSITADKVLLGYSENMLPMSGVDQGATTEPHRAQGARSLDLYTNASRDYRNMIWVKGLDADHAAGVWAYVAGFNSGGLSGDLLYGMAFPVKSGQVFRADVYLMRRGAEPDGRANARLSLLFYDADGAWISTHHGPPNFGQYAATQQISVEATAPNRAAFMRMYAGTDRRSDIGLWRTRLIEMKDSTFITDGGITTPKLAADVLEVGNLKAGTGEIAELVSRKFAAATGQFLNLDVGQLTVTEQSRLADVVAEQIAADTAQFMELEVGKLVASEGILDEAVIKQLFAEVVVSQMSFADEFIGGNAILEGSITAESGIIGSLDLGVAIVGKLHGQYVEAGSIDTEQLAFGAATGDVLSVDALNFKTAVGLDIRGSSFRAGDAVEMTEDFGIRQFGPDGALNVSLPSDGSPAEFRGDLSARTLTATGRMSIQGPGAIASGGVLELESGVVPPVNPPGASAYLERTTFPTLEDSETPLGIAWADGHWWRAVDVSGVSEGDRIEKITPTGELVSSFPIVFFPRNGMTAIGDELFLLGVGDTPGVDHYTSKRYVRVYGLDGTFKRQWEYEEYGTGTYQPGIGTNGTDVVIAQTWAGGSRARTLTWRRFNPANGALRGETHTSYRLSADVVGINLTTADYGTQRVIVTTGRSTGAVEMYTTAGAQVEAGGWYANDHQQVRGTVWANGRFHHLTVEGNLATQSTTIYPNGAAGPDTNDWWAAITWSDGTSETTIGPARRFTFMRRTDLRVSFGTPPEGATEARVYLARKSTEPSRADFRLAGEAPTGAGQATVVLPTDWAQAATPPAANSFPNSTPGIIRSSLGPFEVDGTGAGRWGPLTFHADGTMSSTAVPEWIPVTSFEPGFGPESWGFVPAYRIWPDGKVEWRGVIAGSVTTTVAALTVPIAARPLHPVNLLAATNNTGGADASTRIEFGPLTAPDTMRIYRGSTDRTWVSLDGTSYYLQ